MAHFTTNHVVDINGNGATGEADVDVTIAPRTGGLIRACDRYQDTYRREDGRWWIVRREAEVLPQWTGAIPTDYVRHSDEVDTEAPPQGAGSTDAA